MGHRLATACHFHGEEVMKVRRLATACALAAAASGTIVVLTATPALAAPCSVARNYTYRYAATSSCGTLEPGWQHRAWVTCKWKQGTTTKQDTYYGSWVGTSSTSTAICTAATAFEFVGMGVEQGY